MMDIRLINVDSFVGEWTLARTDCALRLNGSVASEASIRSR